MTDERIDALVRRLDIPSEVDPTFVELTLGVLAPQVRRARGRDRQMFGRLWATVRPQSRSVIRAASPTMRLAITLTVVALLVVALVATVLLVGALRRPSFGVNGPLVVTRDGELLVINPETSQVQPILHETSPIVGLTRSPDGRFMAFWTGPGDGTQFEVANVDGSERRQLASTLGVLRAGCIEDWSPDSKSIASSVTDHGQTRIMVADIATGNASFVTPPGVVAECPLWSPDGRTIAFQHDIADGHSTLAVIGRDGSDMRDLSTDLVGLSDLGTNGWSPDGSFVYFGAGGTGTTAIFRSNVKTATSERLTTSTIQPFAPMVSPDGGFVSFIVWGAGHWDLHLMRSDGTGEHRLLVYATNNGWSSDGKYLLAQWHQPSPGAANGGLTLVTPDGVTRRVVLPFDWVCPTNPANDQPRCLDGAGWGEPIP